MTKSLETPRLVAIYVAPDKGAPMVSVPHVDALAGKGLAGDRYADGKGSFSHARPPVTRHITLIASEVIAAANCGLPEAKAWNAGETRRNLVTVGLGNLNWLVDRSLSISGVAMRGIEVALPCRRPEKLTKKPGFEECFAQAGGLRAEILDTGILAVGDDITVELAELDEAFLKLATARTHSHGEAWQAFLEAQESAGLANLQDAQQRRTW